MNNHHDAKPVSASRRHFLQNSLQVSAGAAVAVALVGTETEAAPTAEAANSPQQQGYQETTHVRDYYRTADL